MIVFAGIASLFYLLYVLFLLSGKLGLPLLQEKGPEAHEISVVIPFRNEAEQLPRLLESLACLRTYPKEIFFVDDHSEDHSAGLVRDAAFPSRLLRVSGEEAGKKAALRTGISEARGTYILTWDADIVVPADYFEVLGKQGRADLQILPVRMHARNLQGGIWEFENLFLQLLNRSCALLNRPIMASGANLLFRRDTFYEVSRFERHGHLSSGDDQFLLGDMLAAGKKVALCRGPLVETAAPESWKAAMQQHLRWIGKNRAVHDRFANFAGAYGLLAALIPSVLAALLWSSSFVWVVIGGKFLLEWLLFFDSKRIGTTLAAPMLLMVYPFIGCWIAIQSLVVRPGWKGRLTNVDRVR